MTEPIIFTVHVAGRLHPLGQECSRCGADLKVAYLGAFPEGTQVATTGEYGANVYKVEGRPLAADERECVAPPPA